jgi:hypothetical protein
MWSARRSPAPEETNEGQTFSLLPYLGIVLAGGVVVTIIHEQWLQPFAKVLLGTGSLTVLIVVRQILAIRENERLRIEVERSNALLRSLSQLITDICSIRCF